MGKINILPNNIINCSKSTQRIYSTLNEEQKKVFKDILGIEEKNNNESKNRYKL